MNFRQLLLILILAQVAFSACTGFSEKFDVRVLDARYRPIPNASVWIKYDRGVTFGDIYFTTPPKPTDLDGLVHFDIYNEGSATTRILDCSIVIWGKADEGSRSITIVANQHPNPVDVVLSDVYPVQFYVRDQLGTPLTGAAVMLGNRTRQTDEYGITRFFYKKGDYNYLASYGDAMQAGKLKIANDTAFEIIFNYYYTSLDVIDEAGTPLQATLYIANSTVLLADGHYENNRSFGDEIPYSVDYVGIVNSGTLTQSQPNAKLIYDLHAPLFGNADITTVNNRPKLTMSITDPGTYASGVDPRTFKVTYRLEPAEPTTPWSTAVTFAVGARNTFAAQLPEMPPNRIVQFRAEIKDMAGNKANLDGKFSTFVGDGTVGNNTQNQTKPPENGSKDQGIPLVYVLIGVIAVVLVIYFVFRTRAAGGGSG